MRSFLTSWMLLLAVLFLGGRLSAAVITWNNAGTDWATGANWVGATAPADDTTTDTATFTGAVTNNPNLGANRSVFGVDFQSAGWSFSPNNRTLTLGAGGIDSAGAGTNTVDVDLSLAADQTWTIGAGNQLNHDETINGTGRLTKDGAGTLFLDGNNNWSGGLTLDAGLLILGHDDATRSGTFIINGGSIAAQTTNVDISESIIINGDLTFDASGTNRLDFDGSIDLGGGIRTITDLDNADFRWNGVVSNGGLIINESSGGNFQLQGNNTYTLGTELQAGGINVNHNNAFGTGAVNVTGNTTLRSNVDSRTLSNNFNLTANLTFNSNSMELTGTVDLMGGTRQINSSINDSDLITISGQVTNGVLRKTGADKLLLTNGTNNFTSSQLDTGTLVAGHNTALGAGNIDFSDGFLGSDNDARTLANNMVFSGNGGFRGEAITMTGTMDVGASNRTLTVATNSGDVATLSGVISGTGDLTKDGSETLLFSGGTANTHSGKLIVTQGKVQLGKTAGVDAVAGALDVGDGTGADTLELLASNQLADTSDVTIADNAVFHLNDFSERVDTLSFGSGSIDFGTASGSNVFLFSTEGTDSGVITLDDFQSGTDVIAVENGVVLSAAFLSSIRFAGSVAGAEVDPGNTNQVVGGYGSTWDYLRPITITEIWDGGGADDNFNTNLNWQDNSAPGSGNNVQVQLAGSTRPNITLSANHTLQALEFNGGVNFTLTGASQLIFDSTTTQSDLVQASANNLTIGTSVALNQDLAVSGTGTGTITLSGVVSGVQKVTKSGDFELELSGNNTFSDDFVLNAGTASACHDNAYGTADIQINGGTLAASGGARTISNTLRINDDFAIGGTQVLEFDGSINLQDGTSYTITVNNTADTTISGAFTNGNTGNDGTDIHKAGSGRLIITSDNDSNQEIRDFYLEAGTIAVGHNDALGDVNLFFAGGTIEAFGGARTINADGSFFVTGDFTVGGSNNLTLQDTFELGGGSRAITVNNTATTTITGEIKDGQIVMNGTGTLRINSDNDDAGELSGFTLNSGTFLWGHDSAAGSGTVTINGGTIQTINGIDVSENFVFGGDFNFSGSEELDITGGNVDLNGGTRTITHTSAQTLRFHNGADIQNGGLILNGTGEYIFDTASTYAGGTTFNAGILEVGHDNAFGTGTLTLNGGTIQSDADGNNPANNVVIGGDLTFEVNRLTLEGDMDLGGATRTFNIATNGGKYVTFNGALSNGGFTKMGAQDLYLGGTTASTYTGTTTVNEADIRLQKTAGVNAIGGDLVIGDAAGTDRVQLYAANQIADDSDVTVNAGAQLELRGFDETVGSITGTGTIENGNSGNSTLTVNTDSTDTFSGLLQNGGGTLHLSVIGSGELILDGTTTYTGDTTVGGSARLGIGADNQLVTSTDLYLSGGTFDTNGFSQTFDNLTLTADSVLDMGAATSVVTFDTANLGSHTLSVWNWSGSPFGGGDDQLFISTIATGAVYNQIRFYSDDGHTLQGFGPRFARQLGTDELVPIPEPSTWLSLAGLLGLIGWHARRCRVQKKGL